MRSEAGSEGKQMVVPKGSGCRLACGVVVVVALAITGCSGSKPSAEKCAEVPAALSDVPTRTDQEPKMRIPLPTGWERSTKMDNESIRFAIRNPALTVDGFTPNAVVTLQKIGSEIPKPEKVLEAQNEQLVTKLKLTDVSTSPGQVCGATALSSTYTAPEVKLGPKIPPVPPRTASAVSAVYRSSEANYIATLTVQTIRPDDKTYVADSATILKGFQLLPPG
jgi:hypothetical protein